MNAFSGGVMNATVDEPPRRNRRTSQTDELTTSAPFSPQGHGTAANSPTRTKKLACPSTLCVGPMRMSSIAIHPYTRKTHTKVSCELETNEAHQRQTGRRRLTASAHLMTGFSACLFSLPGIQSS